MKPLVIYRFSLAHLEGDGSLEPPLAILRFTCYFFSQSFDSPSFRLFRPWVLPEGGPDDGCLPAISVRRKSEATRILKAIHIVGCTKSKPGGCMT
jgi:hypothetical protein